MAHLDCNGVELNKGDKVYHVLDAGEFIEGVHEVVGFSVYGMDVLCKVTNPNPRFRLHSGCGERLECGALASSLGLNNLRFTKSRWLKKIT